MISECRERESYTISAMQQQTKTMESQYFIVKCADFISLKTCIKTEKWAGRDRINPPHPREVLTSALANGRVILIFSVNNCHGWHGYAEMLTPPSSTDDGIEEASIDMDGDFCEKKPVEDQSEQCESNVDNYWYYFKVKWLVNFAIEFGEQCLSSKLTEDMLVDNVPLNKSRNWQRVPFEIGQKLCSLIDTSHAQLKDRQEQKRKQELERIPPPFYNAEENICSEETWKTIVNKVEKDLGKIILACPFGSQRYNFLLNTLSF